MQYPFSTLANQNHLIIKDILNGPANGERSLSGFLAVGHQAEKLKM
jgi:hypothetical protein